MPADNIYCSGAYLAAHPDWHTGDSAWKARQIRALLEAHRVQFHTAVEVGCGAGRVLHELAGSYPEARFQGLDVSPDAESFWRDPRDNVQYERRDILQDQRHFDLLLLIDVFEHVEDYIGFLKQLLPRADRFVFHIPLDLHVQGLLRDTQSRVRAVAGHLHYFSKPTALATLADCGYRVIACTYTDGALALPKSAKARLLNVPRRLLFRLSPDLAETLLGGWSLLVLAERL